MEMKEIYSCENYKVLEISLEVGEKMPLHEATSDAFLICKKGKGRITFSDRTIVLSANENLLIKASAPHQMEVLEDFCSNIILESTAKITFIKKESRPFPMSIY